MKLQNKTGWMSATALSLSATLAACGGVGEGVQPVNAVLQPAGGLEGSATAKAIACVTTGLSLKLDFSNGSRGDFTTRATISSSNPAVLEVSNSFVQPASDVIRLLVPKAAGTATITVTYLTFTRTLDVTVLPIANFRTVPASADIAANSTFVMNGVADVEGVATVLGGAVTWAFVAPNDAIATVNAASGAVKGVSAGGLTVRATLPDCGQTADAPVTVANLQSLALSREFGTKDTLVVGTSERLIATGTLDNGKTQDLSTQVTYTTSDATAISLLTSTVSNLLLALKASTPVQFAASFANPSVTAPSIDITPVADSLSSVAVAPASADALAGRTAQFTASGTYASGNTQDITRHVSWTSSDTTAATVQTSTSTAVNGIAGLATAATTASGKTVTVTAASTTGAGQAISAAATLNIK